jgi:hypothetical protein
MELSIDENLPHTVSEVICINCKHRWIAVRPSKCKLKDLECAGCHQQGYVIETGEVFEELSNKAQKG